MSDLVVVPIAILLVGVVLQVLLARVLSGAGKGWLALTACTASFIATAAMWPSIYHGHVLNARIGAWDGPVALTYHVDGLAVFFALMGTSIGAAILLYSVGYMAKDAAATRFYIIMQVFIAGLISLVFASDLLLMYAGWEIVGLCSFMLVGFWYTDPEAATGARKVLVMTHLAGYGLLAAILLLYSRAGTTVWTDPRVSQSFSTGIFVLMLISAVAKSVQFPLHTWIPSAMAAPTPVSALLHAAVYVKAGVYLVARMHSFAPWHYSWRLSVIWLGTATMLVGVLFAMIQHDAKRLLAFHTVSQIGYMMLGLGLGTPLGVAAALLHTLNHGLFKGGLFLGAGAVQHATGTRDMDKLGGLIRRMPRTATLWLISAASIAGVPLFNGFVSKWLIYVAAVKAGFAVPALIAWIVSVLTMFSFMKASSAMFFGTDGPASGRAHESPRVMLAGSALLSAGCIILGIAPQLLINSLIAPALRSMGLQGELNVSWFGFSASTGSFLVWGVGLAVASVAVGGLVYQVVNRRRTQAVPVTAAVTDRWTAPVLASAGPAPLALGPVGLGRRAFAAGDLGASSYGGTHGGGLAVASRPFTGGEPLSAYAGLRASDFSRPIATGLAPFYRWADPDRYYLAVWHTTLAVAAAVARGSEWLERRAVAAVSGLAVLIGLVAGGASGVTRVGEPRVSVATPWPLITAITVALVGLLLVLATSPVLRRQSWLAALAGLGVLGGLLAGSELTRVLLLEAAAFVAVVLLARSGIDRRARNAYLAAAVLSALALVLATLLRDSAAAGLVLGLFVAGFAVKLALVPAYVWLPALARRTPAALVGLVVAVVDVAAFGELIGLRQTAGWLFSPAWPWLTLALLSAVGGAVLALAQHDVKGMLAFSTVTGAGFLVLGVTLAGPFGLAGALAGAAADALSKALLFATVAGAEAERGGLTLAVRGVARRHPLATAGFVLGALATLGVPFTAGFAGHWRIYATALHQGWPLLALLIVATILSVLAYVRVIALVWWGSDADSVPEPHDRVRAITVWATEARPLTVAIVGLALVVLAAGLFPRVLQDWAAL